MNMTLASCSVGSDCTSGRLRRGMCERHYRRWMKTGSTTEPHRVDNLGNYWIVEDGCWLWLGNVWPNGYGKMSVDVHGTRLAHRAMYMEHVGTPPVGLDLDHLCRVKSCVNPSHLEPVSRAVNLDRYFEARISCRSGLHNLNLPGALVPGTRQCYQCRLAKFRRVNTRRRTKAR